MVVVLESIGTAQARVFFAGRSGFSDVVAKLPAIVRFDLASERVGDSRAFRSEMDDRF